MPKAFLLERFAFFMSLRSANSFEEMPRHFFWIRFADSFRDGKISIRLNVKALLNLAA